MTIQIKLTEAQLAPLEVYIFEDIHAEAGDAFPGYIVGRTLHVEEGYTDDGADKKSLAFELLTEASNSCDASGDGAWARLLATVASKVLRG